MKVREYAFEGTADEFERVAPVLRGAVGNDSGGNSQPLVNFAENHGDAGAGKFVTVKQAHRILTRRKLSKSLRRFLRMLYQAGDTKVYSDDLRKALGFDDASDSKGADRFRGLMGAFGRRVVHDVGRDLSFFDDEWNADEHQKAWRLPVSVREAIKQLGGEGWLR